MFKLLLLDQQRMLLWACSTVNWLVILTISWMVTPTINQA